MKIFRLFSILIAVACLSGAGMPTPAHAVDGFVSFGTFFDQANVYSRPGGGLAEYKSEIEIGHRMPLFTGTIRPYINLLTLMDAYNGNGSFHPSSIDYTIGLTWEKQLSADLALFTRLKHFCWHPIDGDGVVAQADYFEIGFRF